MICILPKCKIERENVSQRQGRAFSLFAIMNRKKNNGGKKYATFES